MTARITSGQLKQVNRFLEDGVSNLTLTKDGAQCVIMQGGILQARLKEIMLDLASTFFLPLTDSQVPPIHQSTLLKYRAETTRQGVSGSTPLCYRVFAGFTLKTHAPKAGPCHKDFQYLQNWDFEDKTTIDCLVFWIPRLVPDSTSKTVGEQKTHLTEFRQRLDLPTHHCSSFGSAAILSCLILAHYRVTGERVPLHGLWTSTDSCLAGRERLCLAWCSGALRCDRWHWATGGRFGHVGCFALGVEPACR